MPYCHHPCYAALFGPQILHSPANFRRSGDQRTIYDGQVPTSPAKMVFDYNSPPPNNSGAKSPKVRPKSMQQGNGVVKKSPAENIKNNRPKSNSDISVDRNLQTGDFFFGMNGHRLKTSVAKEVIPESPVVAKQFDKET